MSASTVITFFMQCRGSHVEEKNELKVEVGLKLFIKFQTSLFSLFYWIFHEFFYRLHLFGPLLYLALTVMTPLLFVVIRSLKILQDCLYNTDKIGVLEVS